MNFDKNVTPKSMKNNNFDKNEFTFPDNKE